ncbi:lipid IV(A) 3-deoxy-D-manno-octulosonic acid transferase [Steroidobacter sp. S1-65]|uniref:3-deoxy-D-manno-octulosonic acid transferase n=1 Tax=Steroidobacter gossypii TaxID=2805490 RepID=A0ABS1X3U9_9GAMM|nr:lipid IV(A) 3-deoxy-D-manno-octulosonic acid transferase [Steroidobacter gossypii]MBM0107897.1 lipid IV(A) 3-deoxy-D-manno-octulosonic acid transferase [Steroidobacter gossypii]
MLRSVYTALLYVFAPMALAGTALRGLRDPAYRERLSERFGFTQAAAPARQRRIWIHAVSVGEVQAAAPLVRALLKRYPQHSFLITTATPTGAQRVRALFSDSVTHAYLPYDLPGAVRRFLDRVQPSLAIVMEREIWPNLFGECERREIPILLASARISARSAVRHQKFAALFSAALSHNVIVAAQTQQDAGRYRAIGAQRVLVTGNVKFDIEVPQAARETGEQLRLTQLANRPVWVAGSTHDDEEQQVLAAHRLVVEKQPDALLVLVPRHPNRFDTVRAWLKSEQIDFVARSRNESVTTTTSVLLVDTLGELMSFYAAADIAFVGGSLIATVGGHNLLEPAVLERPILVGPHNFNAPDIAQLMFARGAARQVDSAEQLAAAILDLYANPAARAEMGSKASAIVAENRGALSRVMELIESLLQAPSRTT